jgi:acyl-coenzyme A synthetase/AMP-(fatty) acid ligase
MDVPERIAQIMALGGTESAVYSNGSWWTWSDIAGFGTAIEHALAVVGDPPAEGLTLAVVMRNHPDQVAVILSALVRHHCIVPISSLQSAERIAKEIRTLRPAVVLAETADLADPALFDAVEEVNALVLELADRAVTVRRQLERRPDGEPRPGTAVWMPTSGTTGPPKRVAVTYRDLAIGFDRVRQYSKGNATAAASARLSKGVAISCTPLVHIAGLWEVFQFAVEGRRLAMIDKFEPHAWAAVVAEHRPVVAMLPPAAVRMLLDADIAPEQLASLRALICTTAALQPDVEQRFTERFGLAVLTGYGATEFPGGLSGWTLELKREFGASRPGSVGRPRPGVNIRIVDRQSGQPVSPGTEGLIEVRSAQTVARGNEGWVRTTDLGRSDDEDFLWITGRADGAINRGGFKMLPETIEEALLAHPDVVAAGVVGLKDERLGQVPVAGVEVRPGAGVSEDGLLEWARERLLRYQVPVRVRIVSALPRTPSMKVSRPGVAELFAASSSAPN